MAITAIRMRSRWMLGLAAVLLLAAVVGPGSVASAQVDQPTVLSVVRIANDGSFDRVVFEFLGSGLPTATLHGPLANSPGAVRTDPANDPVAMAGARVLTVAMSPAIATYAAANPPPPLYSGPASFSPSSTANVVQVTEIGDFEGVLSWAVSYRTAATPIVTVLANPTRVVIDIPHAAAPAAPVSQVPNLTG